VGVWSPPTILALGRKSSIIGHMLRYHVAFYLPKTAGEMVVAEALDFPGAVTQGFDLPDARLMIASAMEDLAQILLEEGRPLPVPNADASAPDADLIEIVPLSVHVGSARV
jgi:predicted RNase H-like HicB family nuclease